jgi:hypothetical protein
MSIDVTAGLETELVPRINTRLYKPSNRANRRRVHISHRHLSVPLLQVDLIDTESIKTDDDFPVTWASV